MKARFFFSLQQEVRGPILVLRFTIDVPRKWERLLLVAILVVAGLLGLIPQYIAYRELYPF